MDPLANDILDFWLGDGSVARPEWFRKDPAFDATIRARFGAAVEAAIGGAYAQWLATPRGALALLLLLDQFPRNIFRDTARMYDGDARALAIARAMVARGDDLALGRHERTFVYLPFEHAEDMGAQEESIRLFTGLWRDYGDKTLEWAEKHAVIVRRFGRFPHRNALLGRESTPEEIAFLQQPGSRF
jgi:uncharacterized protein (DUF924 family)